MILVAFSTSTEKFQNIFMPGEPNADMTESFYRGVLEYLSARADSILEARLLYEWIRDGKPMLGFLCATECVRSVADELILREVPFLCITEPYGEVGFLIRAYDGDTADAVKEEVLEVKARYCKITTADELKADLMKSRQTDKQVVHVNRLTLEQIEMLRQLCEENIDGAEIGIDEMEDGTYMFTFHGRQGVSKKGRELTSMNQIYLLMMLKTGGLDGEFNCRSAVNRRATELAAARGFAKPGVDLRLTPAWVVGRGKHYLKVSDSGFEFGVAVNENGRVTLEEQYSMDGNAPDYEDQLNSFMSRIEDPAVTYNSAQAFSHLEGKDAGLSFTPSRDSRIIARTDRDMVSVINRVVMSKIRTSPVMVSEGKWDQKFDLYMKEAASYMNGARLIMDFRNEHDGQDPERVPDGYAREEYDELIKAVASRGYKGLGPYVPAIQCLSRTESFLVRARLPYIKDLDPKKEPSRGDDRGDRRRTIDTDRDFFSGHTGSSASRAHRPHASGDEPVR